MRSSHRRCFAEKVFLKISTNFIGKYLCRSLLSNTLAGLRIGTLLKKRLQNMNFPVNFAKFSRTYSLQNSSWWLFLIFDDYENFSFIQMTWSSVYIWKYKSSFVGVSCHCIPFFLTLSWRRLLSYRNHPLICSAYQWIGFYMITASAMKELS